MKIYVSGPISGYHNGNIGAFKAAARHVEGCGHEALIPHHCAPHEHEGACPRGYAKPFSHDYPQHDSTACFIRGDLRELLTCDGIYLLRYWESSIGARAEFEVAAVSGLGIFYQQAGILPVMTGSVAL